MKHISIVIVMILLGWGHGVPFGNARPGVHPVPWGCVASTFCPRPPR